MGVTLNARFRGVKVCSPSMSFQELGGSGVQLSHLPVVLRSFLSVPGRASPCRAAASTQKWRVPVRWEPQELWWWALGGSEGWAPGMRTFCKFLDELCWLLGLADRRPLYLWGAVGGGHDGALVNMQLEPPVQAAGENHSAGLPGGESRSQEPAVAQPAVPRAWLPTRSAQLGPG